MSNVSALSFIFAFCAGAGVAAETMAIPEGCEAVVSIHRDSCIVSNYVKCGSQTEVHSFSNEELTDKHVFGPDWDLVGYYSDGGRNQVRAAEGSLPEASLSDALKTGESLGARELQFSTGILKGNALDMTSELRMSDEVTQISGQTFRIGMLSRQLVMRKNGVTSQYDFEIFATPDGSLFIEGATDRDQFGRKDRLEWTPRQIAMPGDTGFMAITSNTCGS